jgi:hypothetical protein
LLVCCTAFAQHPTTSEGDETKIIALENLWNQTQMNHEVDAMSKMLHPDFVFTDYEGTVMLKSAFLASIRDPNNKLSLETSDDMKRHRFGDTVVVTGATHEKGTSQRKSVRALRPIYGYLDQVQRRINLRRESTSAD